MIPPGDSLFSPVVASVSSSVSVPSVSKWILKGLTPVQTVAVVSKFSATFKIRPQNLDGAFVGVVDVVLAVASA